MDEPLDVILIRIARTASWQKAKAQLITLASTMPTGSVQRNRLESVIDEFVNHIEENKLHV